VSVGDRFGLASNGSGDHRMSMTETGHRGSSASIDESPAIRRNELNATTTHYSGQPGARRPMKDVVSHA
jgi:hypothetical protein